MVKRRGWGKKLHKSLLIVIIWSHNAMATEHMDQSTNQRPLITVINDPSDQSDHYNLYLKASYQNARGKTTEALRSYQRLFKLSPSPHAYSGLFQTLFSQGMFSSINKLYAAKKTLLSKTFEDNVEMQLIVAQSYMHTNQEAEAERLFLQLINKYPDDEQVSYFSTVAYIKNNQYDKALEFIEKCLSNSALKKRHFLFNFLKSKIYIQKNEIKQALTAIEASIAQFPKFERALLLKAILLEQAGMLNEAINGYKSFLDLVGRDGQVEKQLIQLLFNQNRYTEAVSYLKKINSHSPEHFFDLALIEYNAKNNNAALQHLNKLLKIDPLFEKGRLLKIEILLQTRSLPDLFTCLNDWFKQAKDGDVVIKTYLVLRKAGVPLSSLIRGMQQLETTTSSVNLLSALADLHVEAGNYKQAAHYHTKITKLAADESIISKSLFHLGYIHFMTQQPDKLEKTLHSAIARKNPYPSAYNLLAYHYAKNNKNLPQALDLVEKALTLAPECHSFIDTKGYVLLKLGKRSEAIDIFKKALNLAPGDIAIKQHLLQAQEGGQ